MQITYITDEQAENARMAYAIMSGIPAERFRLNSIRQNTKFHNSAFVSDQAMFRECGSVGCVCGWLSAHEYFNQKGLRWNASGAFVELTLGLDEDEVDLANMAEILFGIGGRFAFNAGASGVNGKREALRRMRMILFLADRITAARNAELEAAEAEMVEALAAAA